MFDELTKYSLGYTINVIISISIKALRCFMKRSKYKRTEVLSVSTVEIS